MPISIRQILNSYSIQELVVELLVIAICVYFVLRFLRGTRGAGVIKGFAVVLVVLTLLIRVLGQTTDAFTRLNFIYDKFIGIMAILLIVVFQPELRHAMIRIGHTRLMGSLNSRNRSHVIDAIAEAVDLLSKQQIGALIAVEREVKLGNIITSGEQIDARCSARLLGTIFWPNSPLHDLGVVVRGDRLIAANAQFPLAEDVILPMHFGSRHRAAVGITVESDCIAVVVSEETGGISIAENGRLESDIPRDQFREVLQRRLATSRSGATGANRRTSDTPDAAVEKSIVDAGALPSSEESNVDLPKNSHSTTKRRPVQSHAFKKEAS